MDKFKLYDAEYRLMQIVWRTEPINSTELCKLCNDELGWKKSTTYTMIRKLCERDILKNENAVVSALVDKKTVLLYESDALLEKGFDSSISNFLATFINEGRLSVGEADELRQLIDTVTDKK